MTLTFRGLMYYGKSVLSSMVTGALQKEYNKKAVIFIISHKVPDTQPWYEKYCLPDKRMTRYYKGLTYGNIRHLKGAIVVFEDIPSWLHRRGSNVIKEMVTTIARANNTFAILTNQYPQALPTALNVELNYDGKERYMRISENKNYTEWILYKEFDEKAISPILDAIENGVEGKAKGRRGYSGWKNPKSIQQQVFKMLDEGKPISEIVKTFPKAQPETIYVYHVRWKRKQK